MAAGAVTCLYGFHLCFKEYAVLRFHLLTRAAGKAAIDPEFSMAAECDTFLTDERMKFSLAEERIVAQFSMAYHQLNAS